jgi:hypothetical protein
VGIVARLIGEVDFGGSATDGSTTLERVILSAHALPELACSTWIDNALRQQPKTYQFGPKRGYVCK